MFDLEKIAQYTDEIDTLLVKIKAELSPEGDEEAIGRLGKKLTADERMVIAQLDNGLNPQMKGRDLLTSEDIMEGIERSHPPLAKQLSVIRVGRIMRKSGRFHSIRMHSRGQSWRVWAVRNRHQYKGLMGSEVFRQYNEQREAVGLDPVVVEKPESEVPDTPNFF